VTLQVLATGPLATVQDGGRPGRARLGISPSGAADRGAWALGNRLVGNAAGAAAIEVTLGGLRVRAVRAVVATLTGAESPATVAGRPVATNAPFVIPAGAVLDIGRPRNGLRTYLAVRGGIATHPVLGSRSTDTLGGIGRPALAVDDELPIGAPGAPMPDTDWAVPRSPAGTLRIQPGPRASWFTAAARHRLVDATWTVTTELDRIGVRLTGPTLERAINAELPSEGIIRGAVQVPTNGQPLIFLADHPTTGGYPVIAVVVDSDTDALAQLRPGATIRLRWA
jgi:biotin-dependent carboxylase-like uncharacterized protein